MLPLANLLKMSNIEGFLALVGAMERKPGERQQSVTRNSSLSRKCAFLNSLPRSMEPIISPKSEEVMENFDDLIKRLLEIQSGERQKSPKLIAEDERLMNLLQKRNLAGKLPQTVRLSRDSGEQV